MPVCPAWGLQEPSCTGNTHGPPAWRFDMHAGWFLACRPLPVWRSARSAALPAPSPQVYRLCLCRPGGAAVPGPAGPVRGVAAHRCPAGNRASRPLLGVPCRRRRSGRCASLARLQACLPLLHPNVCCIGARALLPPPSGRTHNFGLSLFWCYWWPASFLVYPFLGRVWCAGGARPARGVSTRQRQLLCPPQYLALPFQAPWFGKLPP